MKKRKEKGKTEYEINYKPMLTRVMNPNNELEQQRNQELENRDLKIEFQDSENDMESLLNSMVNV